MDDNASQIEATLKLRRRVAVELLLFLVGSALYLGLWPDRPRYADVTFGLGGMSLILLLAWRTNEQVWGVALPDPCRRLRESCRAMIFATTPVVAIFAAAALIAQHHEQGVGTLHRLFRPTFFLTLGFYFVYAWMQQALFQYYLLGRLRVLMPRAAPWRLALLNGTLFGLMHLCTRPDVTLVLLTVGGGVVWTLAYCRWRCLLPIALSHMILGATYFHWVRDSDEMAKLLAAFAGQSR
ncbi:MAG: CPBP family intramembrane metalloprotease [Planctomycetota bacterium]|nr:CPBP family intramembrane metalloprotease [Planctomycetota bacterium]